MSRTAAARWPVLAALSGACLLLVLAAARRCSTEGSPASDPGPPDVGALLRSDRRVADLLGGCARSGFYDRDLSDPAPVLLEKLMGASPDPMKRAKEELGQLGARAFPSLRLAFHANYTDLMRSAYLENVVDALAFNTSDESHELLLEALRHPQESVRSKALDGLTRNARPDDFALLAERLKIEERDLRRQSVAPMFKADRELAEELFLDFITSGTERDLWALGAAFLVETNDEATARRCAELYPALDAGLAIQLAAAAARHGDRDALAFVQAASQADEPQRRLTALSALNKAGLVDELARALSEDRSSECRLIAAAALAGADPREDRQRWLRAALNDAHPGVRGEALTGLCAQGDPEALARAMAQLDGEPAALLAALQALRGPMRGDPTVAQRVFDQLLQRHGLEAHRPLSQRSATFKAFGQVPSRAAAEFLHGIGVEAGADRMESLRAHDWLMIQAANTGVEGRGALADILAEETDPMRRIDLIDAIGSARDDLAREVILRCVENEAASPLERLFAAGVLIKVGPFWEIAPRLKRVSYTLTGPDVSMRDARAGLQCLLWKWY